MVFQIAAVKIELRMPQQSYRDDVVVQHQEENIQSQAAISNDSAVVFFKRTR
jgi:hypothetical protein